MAGSITLNRRIPGIFRRRTCGRIGICSLIEQRWSNHANMLWKSIWFRMWSCWVKIVNWTVGSFANFSAIISENSEENSRTWMFLAVVDDRGRRSSGRRDDRERDIRRHTLSSDMLHYANQGGSLQRSMDLEVNIQISHATWHLSSRKCSSLTPHDHFSNSRIELITISDLPTGFNRCTKFNFGSVYPRRRCWTFPIWLKNRHSASWNSFFVCFLIWNPWNAARLNVSKCSIFRVSPSACHLHRLETTKQKPHFYTLEESFFDFYYFLHLF
jgi:hypothetical protein